jgi:hypothetical protein
MSYRPQPFVLALSIILVLPSASALGQIGRGVGGIGGRPGIGGARPGIGGAPGLSSPRSGLGIRSNPIVNPAPSLTPNQVLNPRGSLSSGQVLNPAPSLRRPRSGGASTAALNARSAAQQTGSGGSASRRARPRTGYSTRSHFDDLAAELRRFKNGESWGKYLALPQEVLSDETTEGVSEQASKLLKRFDKLDSDPAYAKVAALPAFWLAHQSLRLKVDPTGALLPSSAAPRAADRTIPSSRDTVPTHRTAGERILQSVPALDARIAKITPDGEWPKRLSLDELRIAIPVLSEQPANDSERKSLEEILKSYQAIAKNKQDSVVNELPEFKETLEALQEYLSPLDVRRRQDLGLNFDQLGDQLRKFKNGESWAKYLVPPKELLSDETTDGASESTSKLLKRFDKLVSNPTYAKVTRLPAFEPAYESLKVVVHQPDPSPSTSVVPNPQPVAAADPQPVAAADKEPVAVTDKKSEQTPGATQPRVAESTETRSRATDPARKRLTAGDRVLQSVMALDHQLAKVASESQWPKRLSVDDLLVAISTLSQQPASDAERKTIEGILETYQAVAKNEDDAVVNQLPEFKETLQGLKEYLSPLKDRSRD